MRTPILLTDRLILKPIEKKDASDIFHCWMQDHEVAKYMFWKESNDFRDTESFVDYELSKIEDDRWYRFFLSTKVDNAIIGTCLLYYNEEESSWDISYNLGRKYWHQGYITEAMKKVIEFGFSKLNITRIIAMHAIENEASQKVIIKLGFRHVKDIDYICNGGLVKTKGKYYELCK